MLFALALPFAILFEGPLTAAAVAGGAVSVPIIIHLLNRKRFKVVSWAAMRFLLAAQKKNSRRMRLEQLLLLIVRCLLLLLIVLAMFAVSDWADDHVWQKLSPQSARKLASGGQRAHKILVLDGSFSMAFHGDERETNFERARKLAVQVVRDAPRGDAFSVVLMCSAGRLVVSEASESGDKVIDEIEKLRQPETGADLGGTLTSVVSILKDSPPKYTRKEVFFFTDLQHSTWIAQQSASHNLLLQSFRERKVDTVFVDVGKDDAPNLAVTSLGLHEDVATTERPTTVLATLHNYGLKAREKVRVKFLVGRFVDKESGFTLTLKEERVLDRADAAQDTLVAFSYAFDKPGDYVIQVQIENDGLALDDVRSGVVAVRKDTRVLLVNGRPFGERLAQSAEWVRISLNPYPEGHPPPPNVTARPKVITPTDFADDVRGDLTGYDCVFLCDVPTLSENTVNRLETFVRGGGGLVISLGGQVQMKDYNERLYRDGAGLLPVPLVAPRSGNAAYNFKFNVNGDWLKEPPLKAFSTTLDQGSLQKPRFHRYWELGDAKSIVKPRRVLELESELIPGQEDEARDVSRPEGRRPFILEWQPPVAVEAKSVRKPAAVSRMRGRVVVIAGPVNGDWSDWPATHGFPPLMEEILHYAAAGRLRERSLDAGRPLELFLNTPARDVRAIVHTPDGRTEKATVNDLGEGSHVRFTDTDVTGIYRVVVTTGKQTEKNLFAVNVPARNDDRLSTESDLKRTTQEELTKNYPALDYLQVVRDPSQRIPRPFVATAGEETSKPSKRTTIGATIARWLALAVLALFFLEVVFAWAFAHHTDRPQEEEAVSPRKRAVKGWVLLFVPLALFTFLLGVAVILLHDARTGDFLGFMPDGMRRGAERALEVKAPAPGEKPTWRLEYTSYFWDDKRDPWLVGVVAVVALAVLVFIYRHEKGRATAKHRVLLVCLLLGFLGLLLVVIGPQLKLHFDRQSWPNLVLVIDDSFSMSATERYGDPNDREAADRLANEAERLARDKVELAGKHEAAAAQKDDAAVQLAVDDPEKGRITQEARALRERAQELRQEAEALDSTRQGGDMQRLQLVCALLTRENGRWLATLLSQREFKVHVYHCSNQTMRVASMTEPSQLKDALHAVESLTASPNNDASHLGAALRQVVKDFRGTSLSAVVMLTDGVVTEGVETLTDASQAASDTGIPLYFVGVGDAHEIRDVSLQGLKAEDTVFVNDHLVFELTVVAKGYKNIKLPVTLREKGGKKLDEKEVQIDANSTPVKVRFVHQPKEAGEKTYEIEVPAQEDEVDKDNNRIEHVVSVRQTATIKVLYVEGYRRYEYHFLKTLLERESNRVKGNKTLKLRVRLLDADKGYQAMEGKDTDGEQRVLSDYPTAKELEGYQVVILGDINPKPEIDTEKTHEFLKNLAEFVEKHGGGLLMIGGERYAPFAYRDSPLRDVLPIEVFAERNPDEMNRTLTRGYRPLLTPVGRGHPIFRFSPDEKASDEIWKKLRELFWYAEGYRAKRAAEVLAIHPTMKQTDKPGQGGQPLVVQQFIGAGRSMFLGFNETWRWGWREDQVYYNQFWIQAIRYMARSRLGRVRLDLDRQAPYRRGEPIRVTVRFPDEAPAPDDTSVIVHAERRSPGHGAVKWEMKLSKLPGSRATYEDVLTQTPEGEYKFHFDIPPAWKAKVENVNYTPRAECRVVAPPGEKYGLRMNANEMKQVADDTGGGFYTLADADKLPASLPKGEPGPRSPAGDPILLWSSSIVFLAALMLFTTVWVIRKELNLL